MLALGFFVFLFSNATWANPRDTLLNEKPIHSLDSLIADLISTQREFDQSKYLDNLLNATESSAKGNSKALNQFLENERYLHAKPFCRQEAVNDPPQGNAESVAHPVS